MRFPEKSKEVERRLRHVYGKDGRHGDLMGVLEGVLELA